MHGLLLLFLFAVLGSETPPGTVKFSDSLYVDQAEINNVSWRECLYWNRRVYGDTSQQYLSMLPDSTCWKNPGLTFDMYFRHPSFQNYPVVCISYSQAVAFCRWRSDRVNEALYRKRNKINVSESLDFSKVVIPVVVTYRLPSAEEWERIATGTDPATSVFQEPMPAAAWQKKKSRGMVHLAGNVSEMTAKEGVAKGCNYTQKVQEFDIKATIPYSKPQSWLGFRCVCETTGSL